MKNQKAGRKSQAAKTVALYGVLIALAFVFSYVEAMIPLSFAVPGMKLGLANLVVVTALYLLGVRTAFWVSVIRIILVGFTFGSLSAMIFSLSGGILSFVVMAACKNKNLFHTEGVSMAGGIAHNVGQLLAAAALVESAALFYYVPVLLVFGMVTGGLTGLLAKQLIKRIRIYIPF